MSTDALDEVEGWLEIPGLRERLGLGGKRALLAAYGPEAESAWDGPLRLAWQVAGCRGLGHQVWLLYDWGERAYVIQHGENPEAVVLVARDRLMKGRARRAESGWLVEEVVGFFVRCHGAEAGLRSPSFAEDEADEV